MARTQISDPGQTPPQGVDKIIDSVARCAVGQVPSKPLGQSSGFPPSQAQNKMPAIENRENWQEKSRQEFRQDIPADAQKESRSEVGQLAHEHSQFDFPGLCQRSRAAHRTAPHPRGQRLSGRR